MPTPEQSAAIDRFPSGESFQIDGVAGCGKTTTLVGGAQRLSGHVVALAFNSRNRTDFKERMPQHVESHTFNSLGHKVLLNSIRGKISLNDWKISDLIRAYIEKFSSEIELEDGMESPSEFYAGTRQVLSMAKMSGYLPAGIPGGISLVDEFEFFNDIDEKLDDPWLGPRAVDWILKESVRMALQDRIIDYGDQICLPLQFRLGIPRVPTVIVDEDQDLAPIQHLWLRQMAPKQLIGVGDPHQAIYGWRGADCQSISTLVNLFGLDRMPLTFCFRCPTSVITEAQQWVPHIRAPEGTRAGLVERKFEMDFSELRDGDVILCRNNSPLFAVAIQLLLRGIKPNVLGAGDLARGLKNFPKTKLGLEDPESIDVLLLRLDAWLATELARTRSDDKKARLHERADCVRLFAAGQSTVAGYKALVESTFREGGGKITLSTIHKFKGMEASRVHVLRPDLLQPWGDQLTDPDALQQARNLQYVAATRAAEELRYVDKFDDGD